LLRLVSGTKVCGASPVNIKSQWETVTCISVRTCLLVSHAQIELAGDGMRVVVSAVRAHIFNVDVVCVAMEVLARTCLGHASHQVHCFSVAASSGDLSNTSALAVLFKTKHICQMVVCRHRFCCRVGYSDDGGGIWGHRNGTVGHPCSNDQQNGNPGGLSFTAQLGYVPCA
jgi:hypothetical protein